MPFSAQTEVGAKHSHYNQTAEVSEVVNGGSSSRMVVNYFFSGVGYARIRLSPEKASILWQVYTYNNLRQLPKSVRLSPLLYFTKYNP